MEVSSTHRINRGLHRFAVFTSCCTFLLIGAGALVTSNDAGLAVPDWPLSYGSLLPPMVGGILYEHGHRMIAAFVGILTVILAIWLWRSEPRRWVRNFGLGAVGLIVAQGLLGGITVKFFLPPPVSMAHATLAQLFFITTICLAVFTGAWWQSDLSEIADGGAPPLRTLGALTTAAIVLQIVLGAGYRHHAFGILPHLLGAALVTLMVVFTGRAARERFRDVRPLRQAAIWLHATFGTQILLGLLAYWAVQQTRDAVQPQALTILITVAHVLFGALTLAAGMMITLRAYRLTHRAGAVTANSTAERARV